MLITRPINLKCLVLTSVEEYERSWEQNEELGLNDMDTSSADNAYNTATHPTTGQ